MVGLGVRARMNFRVRVKIRIRVKVWARVWALSHTLLLLMSML
jgi:hypothetical protein